VIAQRERFGDQTVPFKKIASQAFEHTDGYRVQMASGLSAEYIQGPRRALVEVDLRAPRIRLFARRVSGWFIGAETRPMTADDQATVVERVAAAFEFDGMNVEVVPM
jgi:hypothetical protein